MSGLRVPNYPTARQRVEYLKGAATVFGVVVPEAYETHFEPDTEEGETVKVRSKH
jgi:hypothetical protein